MSFIVVRNFNWINSLLKDFNVIFSSIFDIQKFLVNML